MTTATTARQGHMPLDGVKDTRGSVRAAQRRSGIGVPARKSNSGVIIGGRWKIQTGGDGLNVIVYRNQGKSWRAEAYVSTLAAALTWLVNQNVRESDLSDLKAVVARIEELRREIIGIAAG